MSTSKESVAPGASSSEADEEPTTVITGKGPVLEHSGYAHAAAADQGRLEEGMRVGRYLLLKEVGKGGMGVVYAAYDPELDRKVALKLLLLEAQEVDLARRRAWLLREAQAMARVSHPNVIPVFDVGAWGEHVFIAMEFVEGETLDAWLRQGRAWREVLEVFLAAGQGLTAAHAAGLVHRDFKPSNVLLGRHGRVYVTDFGLARRAAGYEENSERRGPAEDLPPGQRRLLEEKSHSGLVLGTPHYMAPEQYLAGNLDARADQFSFCAALYWALYRQRPFEPRQVAAFARSREAASPGGRQPESAGGRVDLIRPPPREARVPAWVHRVLMRGLALEAGGRFASMEALLRALSQEQRRARRRWAAGVGVATALGLAALGVQLHQRAQVCTGAEQLMAEVWTPDVQQKLQAAFASTGLPFASDAARGASQALEHYAQAWVQQHTQACRATRVQGVQTEQMLAQRVVCLERRRKEFRALAGVLVQADAALVERAVGVAHSLPALQECEDVEALAQQQSMPADPGLRASIERLADRMAELKALLEAGRYPQALELANQLEPEVRATGYLPLTAELYLHRGYLQFKMHQPKKAESDIAQAVYDAQAGRADRTLITALFRLTFVYGLQRLDAQAELCGRLAEAALRRVGNEPHLAGDLLGTLGAVALEQGHHQEALKLLERARAQHRQVLPEGHPNHARVLYMLGGVAFELGEHSQALALMQESLQRTEASLGPRHPDVAMRHATLSLVLRGAGDYPAALRHAQASVDINQAVFGPEHSEVADALDELSMDLLGLRRYGEALEVSQRALEIKLKSLGPEDESLSYSYDGVGQALLGLGRLPEAIASLERALSFSSVEAQGLGESSLALARALWQSGQRKRALAEAVRAREHFTRAARPQRVAEVDAWLRAHGRL